MLHKPTVLVENELRAGVFSMMREFVDKRGVCMDANEPVTTRRSRTIIYSASSISATLSADRIFKIENGMVTEQVRVTRSYTERKQPTRSTRSQLICSAFGSPTALPRTLCVSDLYVAHHSQRNKAREKLLSLLLGAQTELVGNAHTN